MKKLAIVLAILLVPCFAFAGTIDWTFTGENPDGFVIVFWDRTDQPATTTTPFDWNDPKLYYIHVPDGTARNVAFDDANLWEGIDYAFYGYAYNMAGWSTQSAEADKTAWGGGTWVGNPPVLPTDPTKMPPVVITPNSITITIQ
jgi:hypothetical protein